MCFISSFYRSKSSDDLKTLTFIMDCFVGKNAIGAGWKEEHLSSQLFCLGSLKQSMIIKFIGASEDSAENSQVWQASESTVARGEMPTQTPGCAEELLCLPNECYEMGGRKGSNPKPEFCWTLCEKGNPRERNPSLEQ